ncbi:DNA-processing protein DprA [bacterium]|nr:DNA-processing protein DprA [bacterium]
MQHLHDLLHLISVPGLGNRRIQQLVDEFGSPAEVIRAGEEALCLAGLDKKTAGNIVRIPDPADAERQVESAAGLQIQMISLWDTRYPETLKTIHDPPVLLYVKGNAESLSDDRCVAVVGTRGPTAYGRRMAEMLAGELADRGIIVVSGMARGIDTCAHRASLEHGYRTWGILGCGLNVVYPPENSRLYEQVQRDGLLVTEFPLGEQPLADHFPRRNRIISGLCLGTVVIEAGERSGALITAYMALEQGREVFAVPGQAGQKMSRGPHRLIREGAKLVENVQDILEEIPQLQTPGSFRPDRTGREMPLVGQMNDSEKRFWDILTFEPKHIDAITSELQMSTSEALAQLLSMELKNYIRQVSGMMFIRR